MKLKRSHHQSGNRVHLIHAFPVSGSIVSMTLGILLATAGMARAQIDDFDDGNDDGWTRFDPLGGLGLPEATFSFPNGGYRLQAPPPPIPDAGPARAFSYLTENSYTEFYAAVDVVDWDNSVDQAFGILGRAGNIGLGQTTGYVCNYNPNQTGSRPGGEFQINRVTGEAEAGTLATANITLIPGRSYRMVFIGTGTVMTGHLYDHLDLTAPVATITVDGTEDDRVLTHPEGVFGLFVFSRDDATGANSIGDATFDNFFVASPALVTLPGPGIAHPVPGTPQVVNRTPASQAAFHPATEGIEFAAIAPGGAAVDASNVRLFLNGNDVTGDLDFTPTALGVEVSLDALEENRVYQARIIVSDGAAISTTNEFVFDTFTQAFLESAGVMVIEAEDYNYGNGVCEPPTAVPPTSGGLYQNNPPPSGFINNQRVPEDGTGYLDKFGLIEVDYSDATGQAGGSPDSYRICDSVDTAPGGLEIEPGPIVNDVERAKYALAGVPDYQVIDTEAGEWLNYTRDFVEGDYHVFLRVASTAAQEVFLDRVSGDTTSNQQTTTRLGTFEVPNTHLRIRYQHVPLTDESGNPVVVNFPGTDTVRLTVGGEPGTFETERTMALNYLVFVPATTLPPMPPMLEQPAREGSNFQFSFMAAAGSSYRVQSTPSLEDAQWADLQTIDGGGAMETFSQAIEGDARYFRVIVE